MEKNKKCKVVWCDRESYAKGYCEKHYMQVRKHGVPHRSRFDPNEFINNGDICYILLYDKNGNFTDRALIDIEDVAKCKEYKWRRRDARYVVASVGNRKNLYLHHLIFGEKCEIDHRFGDTLDNRKKNLRRSSRAENSQNAGRYKNNKSGYKGVSWSISHRKWVVQIACCKQRYWLGDFDDPVLAAAAYNKAAINLHGEFARLNVLPV